MKNSESKIGIIILAAGQSSRMGQPKQLLKIGEKSLIRHIAAVALATECRPVVLVIGANKALVAPEIADLPLVFIDNPQWQTGMSTSLKMGMVGIYLTDKAIEAVLILVCDQPYLSPELLNQMITVYESSGKGIVVCRYDNQLGVPVLFGRKYFEQLISLKGDEGAKSIIKENLTDAEVVDFEAGKFDLDTPEDYQYWINHA